jgi:transposase InsO family protein
LHQTHDGARLRLTTLIDEFTRKCLAIRVARRINATGVIETLADAVLFEGTPDYIRSDNGHGMKLWPLKYRTRARSRDRIEITAGLAQRASPHRALGYRSPREFSPTDQPKRASGATQHGPNAREGCSR